MKKFLLSFLTVAIGAAVIMILFFSLAGQNGPKYVYKGNTDHKPIAIKPGEYQCSECNMDVENLDYAVELITKDGVTYFFDDIGCLVLWLQKHHPEEPTILTRTLDTKKWVDVKKAWYTRTASTPMGYGFAAYEKKGEGMIAYEEMKKLMLQGKTLRDPFVKKSLLGG